MNDDLIKRSDALKVAYRYCPDDDGSCSCADRDLREMLNDMEDIPSADRPQGEWIIHKINGIPHTAECSCCHNHYDYEDLRRIGGIKEIIALPYCPDCGARMKGADDEVR